MSLQEAELIRALYGMGWAPRIIEGGWRMVVPMVVDLDQRPGAPFPILFSHIGTIMRNMDGTWPKPHIRVRVKGRYTDWRTYPRELLRNGAYRRHVDFAAATLPLA